MKALWDNEIILGMIGFNLVAKIFKKHLKNTLLHEIGLKSETTSGHCFFLDEADIWSFYTTVYMAVSEAKSNSSYHIGPYNVPCMLEEVWSKPIRSWTFIRVDGEHGFSNLFIRDGFDQLFSIIIIDFISDRHLSKNGGVYLLIFVCWKFLKYFSKVVATSFCPFHSRSSVSFIFQIFFLDLASFILLWKKLLHLSPNNIQTHSEFCRISALSMWHIIDYSLFRWLAGNEVVVKKVFLELHLSIFQFFINP